LTATARAEQVTTLKVGSQKTNLPVTAKKLGVIETALQPKGIAVEWAEFPAGSTWSMR
jgi:hypothetical protein